MKLKRRKVLQGMAAGAALLAGPEWLKRAFGGEICPAGNERPGEARVTTSVQRALALAKERGKPLLVLVVPPDRSAAWHRGSLLGAWLNCGTDHERAPLALAEVVCATAAEIPGATLKDDPWMVLVESDGAVRALPVPPIDPNTAYQPQGIDDGIAKLAQAARGALVEGRGTLARRGSEARRALGARAPAVDQAIASGADLAELADPGAALLALAAVERAADRAAVAKLEGALAAAAATRLTKQPPLGAKWGRSYGCGTEIEGEKDPERGAVACGMGCTPPKAQRFLAFYTATLRKQ